ncbi:accessory Sec system protein Asp2 [Priestia megaterium]|uniref:accessory Sec system protein Asp2 n=1 Tax=Priestia megaterium TaxID=1404 RepID=UPI0036707822
MKDKILENEKVFRSIQDVTYYFEEGEVKDHLIIVFSAVNPPGTFAYNYISTLENLNCHKLFILDNYGEQGAYYLGYKKDFSIETSVMSLIMSIIAKYQVKLNNVITVGSSKGGYAALYYALKYGFGHAIAGGPQVKLGDFLYDQGKNFEIAKYIAGDLNQENHEYLNSLLMSIIPDKEYALTDIYLHVGNGDHHYPNHIIPFIEYLDNLKHEKYQLDIQEYESHDGLRQFFPPYLCEKLGEITGIPSYEINPIKRINLGVVNNTFTVECVTTNTPNQNYQYAYYIYKDNKVYEKIFYSKANKLNYPLEKSGLYKCKVFVKDQHGRKYIQMSESVNIK